MSRPERSATVKPFTFDDWFKSEYGDLGGGEDGLRELLREAWDAALTKDGTPSETERTPTQIGKEIADKLAPSAGEATLRAIIESLCEAAIGLNVGWSRANAEWLRDLALKGLRSATRRTEVCGLCDYERIVNDSDSRGNHG